MSRAPEDTPSNSNANSNGADAPPTASMWRRVGRGLLWFGGGVVALLLTTLAVLLFSDSVARWLVQQGVAQYSGRIEGSILVERVEGDLWSGLKLQGVELRDRDDTALATIGRADLGVEMAPLLTATVRARALHVSDVSVHIPAAERAGFADLAIPSEDEAPPPSPPGPQLPIDLDLRLELGRVVVWGAPAVAEAGGTPTDPVQPPSNERLAVIEQLVIEATGADRTLGARVEMRAQFPGADLDVESLVVAARWDQTKLELSEFSLRSNWGAVDIAATEVAFAPEPSLTPQLASAKLPELRVTGDAEMFERKLNLPVDEQLEVFATASADGASAKAELQVHAPGLVRARIDASGTWAEGTRGDLTGELELQPKRLLEGASAERVQLRTELHLEQAQGGELQLTAVVRCPDCDPQDESTKVEASLAYQPESRSGSARVSAKAPGLSTLARAKLDAKGHFELEADVDVESLARFEALVGRFASPPGLQGHGHMRVRCDGQLPPSSAANGAQAPSPATSPLESATCRTDVELDDGEPVQRVRLAARARADEETLSVEVDRLQIRSRGIDVALGTPEAKVAYGYATDAPRVSFENIDLRVRDTSTGRAAPDPAKVQADGQWQGGDGGSVELDADVEDVDLAWANRFVNGLGLSGRAGVRVRVRGNTRAPELNVDAQLSSLRRGGKGIGTLDLRARTVGEGVRARATLKGPVAQRFELDADVPVHVRLDGPSPALRFDDPVDAALHVRGLDLDRVLDVAGVDAPVSGRGDLDVEIGGSLNQPRVDYALHLHQGAYDEQDLGTLALEGELERDRARAALDWKHPAWRQLSVEAQTGLDVNLARGHIDLEPRADDGVDLTLAGLSLAELRKQLLALVADLQLPEFAGQLDLRVEGRKLWSRPQVAATLDGRNLSYTATPVGRLHAQADITQRAVDVLITLNEARLGDLGIKAKVPVQVDLRRGRLRWRDHDPHELDVAIAGTELEVIDAFTADPLYLSGRAEGRVALRGVLSAPRVDARARVDELGYAGRRAGDLELRSHYGDKLGPGAPAADGTTTNPPEGRQLARAEVHLVHDATRTLRAKALVPLRVDLLTGTVEWLRSRRHELELEAPKIDEQLLAPVMDTPEGTHFELGAQLEAEGTVDRFTAQLAAEGEAQHEGQRIPLALALQADQTEQSVQLLIGDTLRPWLSADAEVRAVISNLVDNPDAWKAVPIAAQVESVDFPLQRVDPLMPPEVQGLEGTLNLHAAIQGDLRKPELSGSLDVTRAAVTVVPLRQRFDFISIAVVLEHEYMRLKKLEAKSGAGRIDGSGEAHFEPDKGVVASLDLFARALPIRRPGLPRMKLSAEFLTRARVDTRATEVEVDIADAQLDIQKGNASAPKAIEEIEGVHYVELVGKEAGWWLEVDPDKGAESEDEAPSQPGLVRVKLLDPLRVTGPGVDMSWTGEVSAVAKAAEVVAKGALTCTTGRFNLLGNDFTIQQGAVRLPEAGGLMPFIDLQADTDVDGVQITATIRGPVSRPTLTLSSQPAYSESDIFTMLVTGSSDVESADPEEVKARAASMLVALSSPGLQAELNETLRVDKVGLTFGDNTDQPILSVGKQISKRLYAESQYHFNAPATKNSGQVSLRYRFAPRWSLETFIGDAAVGGADIFWSLAFDGRLSEALEERRKERERAKAQRASSKSGDVDAEGRNSDRPE